MKPPEFTDDLERGIDYYEMLRVHDRANDEEIHAAFRVRIPTVHPDHGGDHEMAATLLRARATLTGPDRPAYDAARSAKIREAHERFLRAEDARRNAGHRSARPPSPTPQRSPRPSPSRTPGRDPSVTDPAEFLRWDGHAERMAEGERRFQEMKVRLERDRLAHQVEFDRKAREYAAMKARGDRLRAGRSSPLRGDFTAGTDDFLRRIQQETDDMLRKSHEDVEMMARESREEVERWMREGREEIERSMERSRRENQATTDEILWDHRFREP